MSNAILKTVGIRVAAFRHAKNISAEKFCADLQISKKRLTMIEGGRCDMPASQFIAIARYLGVRLSALAGEEPFGGFVDEAAAP